MPCAAICSAVSTSGPFAALAAAGGGVAGVGHSQTTSTAINSRGTATSSMRRASNGRPVAGEGEEGIEAGPVEQPGHGASRTFGNALAGRYNGANGPNRT